MAISIVQSQVINQNGWSGSFSSNVTTGNSIILIATGYVTTTGDTITANSPQYAGGSVANTIQLYGVQSSTAGGLPSGTDGVWTGAWLLPNVTGGSASVSVTVINSSTSAGAVGLFAIEVSGLGASPTLDQVSTGSNTSGTTTNSGTTQAITGTPELVIASAVAWGQSLTLPSSPWSNVAMSDGYSGMGSQTTTTNGGTYSYSAPFSTSASWASGIATIKATQTGPNIVQDGVSAYESSLTLGSGVTAGNALVIGISAYDTSDVTMTLTGLTLGGTSILSSVTQLATATNPGSSTSNIGLVSLYLLPVISGGLAGSTAIATTITNANGSVARSIYAWEVSGLGSTPAVDIHTASSNDNSGTVSLTGTTRLAPELVIGLIWTYSVVITGPSGWSNMYGHDNYDSAGSQVLTSTGSVTYNPTIASSAAWTAVLVSLSTGIVATTSFLVW